MTATARRPTGVLAAQPERRPAKRPSVLGLGLVRHAYPLALLGMLGLYIAAGVGLAYLRSWAGRGAAARRALAAALAVALVVIGTQAVSGRRFADAEVNSMLSEEPWRALNDPHHHHRIERAVIVGLKRKYGMANPDCGAIAGGESDRARP